MRTAVPASSGACLTIDHDIDGLFHVLQCLPNVWAMLISSFNTKSQIIRLLERAYQSCFDVEAANVHAKPLPS
jgi:hypothetical protein